MCPYNATSCILERPPRHLQSQTWWINFAKWLIPTGKKLVPKQARHLSITLDQKHIHLRTNDLRQQLFNILKRSFKWMQWSIYGTHLTNRGNNQGQDWACHNARLHVWCSLVQGSCQVCHLFPRWIRLNESVISLVRRPLHAMFWLAWSHLGSLNAGAFPWWWATSYAILRPKSTRWKSEPLE